MRAEDGGVDAAAVEAEDAGRVEGGGAGRRGHCRWARSCPGVGGGLDDVVFVVDRVGVSIPIIQVGRKISVSFFFLSFPSLVHDSVVSVGRYLR